MPYLPVVTVATLAYLLGSIPFGFVLVLVFRKEDIRKSGSGNIGATNVVRSGAKGLGALTFLLDALKGWLAVLVAGWLAAVLGGATSKFDLQAIAALFAVLGHMYPVWLKFKGGKGVATALGVFLALSPWAALVGFAVFVLVLLLSRYVSLASIASATAFPIAALLLPGERNQLVLIVSVAIPLLVILKHRLNISRLLHGSEYRFGQSKTREAA